MITTSPIYQQPSLGAENVPWLVTHGHATHIIPCLSKLCHIIQPPKKLSATILDILEPHGLGLGTALVADSRGSVPSAPLPTPPASHLPWSPGGTEPLRLKRQVCLLDAALSSWRKHDIGYGQHIFSLGSQFCRPHLVAFESQNSCQISSNGIMLGYVIQIRHGSTLNVHPGLVNPEPFNWQGAI